MQHTYHIHYQKKLGQGKYTEDAGRIVTRNKIEFESDIHNLETTLARYHRVDEVRILSWALLAGLNRDEHSTQTSQSNNSGNLPKALTADQN